ncbi:unnamed protein product [Trichogramma brassicae]|uniref:Uncharacterized protein n=1 Tax=Trichogramma brassicae TaxID=86971 RepID=A0A6H5IC70_9HYME|nr:unnamed protein product [Trichogramma brassicae]
MAESNKDPWEEDMDSGHGSMDKNPDSEEDDKECEKDKEMSKSNECRKKKRRHDRSKTLNSITEVVRKHMKKHYFDINVNVIDEIVRKYFEENAKKAIKKLDKMIEDICCTGSADARSRRRRRRRTRSRRPAPVDCSQIIIGVPIMIGSLWEAGEIVVRHPTTTARRRESVPGSGCFDEGDLRRPTASFVHRYYCRSGPIRTPSSDRRREERRKIKQKEKKIAKKSSKNYAPKKNCKISTKRLSFANAIKTSFAICRRCASCVRREYFTSCCCRVESIDR